MQYRLPISGGPDLALIHERLLDLRGPQRDEFRLDPTRQLVYGILSARTKDAVSWAAFKRLGLRYRSWSDLSRALPHDLEPLIRSVSFPEKKIHYLPSALRTIVQKRRGSFDLRFLADYSEEAGMAWLSELTGVDTKVGATVLNFSILRKRVLAVDTHLLRLGERLGFLPIKPSYRVGYELYMRFIPNEWDADDLYEFHWLLKWLGQEVCHKRQPACQNCILRDLCPSAK